MAEPIDFVDMRGRTPRPIVDVLDAVCLARGGVDRFTIINEVLLKYTRQVAHEAMMVHRVTGSNPRVMDSNWQKPE